MQSRSQPSFTTWAPTLAMIAIPIAFAGTALLFIPAHIGTATRRAIGSALIPDADASEVTLTTRVTEEPPVREAVASPVVPQRSRGFSPVREREEPAPVEDQRAEVRPESAVAEARTVEAPADVAAATVEATPTASSDTDAAATTRTLGEPFVWSRRRSRNVRAASVAPGEEGESAAAPAGDAAGP